LTKKYNTYYTTSFRRKLPAEKKLFFMKIRLSILVFLQFFIYGAITPIISLYLINYLHFSGTQAGFIIGLSSLSAFVSPLIGAFIADRVIHSERLYSICFVLSGFVMWILIGQKDYLTVLLLLLVYYLISGPTFGLLNAIIFHHLPDSKKSYGSIRIWGTIGWIAVAWILGFFWLRSSGSSVVLERLPEALKLSVYCSIILGLYGFTLPLSHAHSELSKKLIPVESVEVFKKFPVIFISIFSFFITIVDRYYYFGIAPFLRSMGFSESSLMPLMSIGQIPELFAMGLLGFILSKKGFKSVIATGIILEMFRFFLFSMGNFLPFLLLGISFHGIAYTLFFASVTIFLDSHCTKKARTGVHQLFSIINAGFGNFFGSFLAGKTMDVFRGVNDVGTNYFSFWMVPGIISVLVLIAFLIVFRNGSRVALKDVTEP